MAELVGFIRTTSRDSFEATERIKCLKLTTEKVITVQYLVFVIVHHYFLNNYDEPIVMVMLNLENQLYLHEFKRELWITLTGWYRTVLPAFGTIGSVAPRLLLSIGITAVVVLS